MSYVALDWAGQLEVVAESRKQGNMARGGFVAKWISLGIDVGSSKDKLFAVCSM